MTNTITITDFVSGAHRLRAKEPLVFGVIYDEDGDFFYPKDNFLGIKADAWSVRSLPDAIRAELGVMWRTYALEDDEKLTPAAQELKRDLLEAFDVMPVS